MQKKIEDLEEQKGKSSMTSFNKSVKDDLNELKTKISKFEYENKNLKEERELFVQ